MKHKSEMAVFNKLSNSKRLDKVNSVSRRQLFTTMRIPSYKVLNLPHLSVQPF